MCVGVAEEEKEEEEDEEEEESGESQKPRKSTSLGGLAALQLTPRAARAVG